jgi:hypothetical protein
MTLLTATTTWLADITPNTGHQLRDVMLGIVGTFALVVMAARALAAFADERYGKMITVFLGAVPIFGMAYFPDQVISILTGLWSTFTKG